MHLPLRHHLLHLTHRNQLLDFHNLAGDVRGHGQEDGAHAFAEAHGGEDVVGAFGEADAGADECDAEVGHGECAGVGEESEGRGWRS